MKKLFVIYGSVMSNLYQSSFFQNLKEFVFVCFTDWNRFLTYTNPVPFYFFNLLYRDYNRFVDTYKSICSQASFEFGKILQCHYLSLVCDDSLVVTLAFYI